MLSSDVKDLLKRLDLHYRECHDNKGIVITCNWHIGTKLCPIVGAIVSYEDLAINAHRAIKQAVESLRNREVSWFTNVLENLEHETPKAASGWGVKYNYVPVKGRDDVSSIVYSDEAEDSIRKQFGPDTHVEPGQNEDGTIGDSGRFL